MLTRQQLDEFLQHSNWIEKEYSEQAFKDSQRAWSLAYTNRNKIDIDYILGIHKALMENIRPDIAGKLRTCDVWIGGKRKKYVGAQNLKDELDIWLTLYNGSVKGFVNSTQVSKKDFAKILHVHFEEIHPFEDGNGRTGRILWQIHRLKLKLPFSIIHEGEEQMEYYKWFKKPKYENRHQRTKKKRQLH